MAGVEPSRFLDGCDDSPHLDGGSRIGDPPLSHRIVLEPFAKQASGGRTDEHGIRIRQRLQLRGQVQRLADDGFLFGWAFADEIPGDHDASLDADARTQMDVMRTSGSNFQSRDRLRELQSCAYRALRIILVGTRIAEENHDSITEKPGSESPELFDNRRAGALVGAYDLAQIFRV